MLKFNINSEEYKKGNPFPHTFQDNILEDIFAEEIQKEILELDSSYFDRYNNPFEQKYTLRDKNNYPPKLNSLMEYLTSEECLNILSNLTGYELVNDPDKNFWGVHKYENGDRLDIHCDAGKHPRAGLKKQVTLGIYLSYKWKEEYECALELWRGDNAKNNDAKIYECTKRIFPMFNRLVIFTNDDFSWHGNPEPCVCPEDSFRIFITISYLSNNTNYDNDRQKAFFIARPSDPEDLEKDKLRLLRADPTRYHEIYRYNQNKT